MAVLHEVILMMLWLEVNIMAILEWQKTVKLMMLRVLVMVSVVMTMLVLGYRSYGLDKQTQVKQAGS